MSGSFTGFSEEDIKKLNNKSHPPLRKAPINAGDAKLKSKAPKRIPNESELRSKVLQEKIKNSPVEPVLESAKLNKIIESPIDLPQTPTLADINSNSNETSANNTVVIKENINKNGTKELTLTSERKIDLDEIQARQKLIEEQNRKKKELVMKALAAKTKQTQEETQRLNEVREEFKKLDVLLSNDVKILRKQIEVASLDYMEAQKRYYKIEKEFLDAKLFLHQKLEKKEMLTEHLCAIIEKNEERKAEKLNELLLKLDLKMESEQKEVLLETTNSINNDEQLTNGIDNK